MIAATTPFTKVPIKKTGAMINHPRKRLPSSPFRPALRSLRAKNKTSPKPKRNRIPVIRRMGQKREFSSGLWAMMICIDDSEALNDCNRCCDAGKDQIIIVAGYMPGQGGIERENRQRD